jgi:hypothetical protein
MARCRSESGLTRSQAAGSTLFRLVGIAVSFEEHRILRSASVIRLVQLGKSVEKNPPSPPSPKESAFVTKSLGTSAIPNVEKVSPDTRGAIEAGGGNSLIRSLLGERARVLQSPGGLEGYYTKPASPTR